MKFSPAIRTLLALMLCLLLPLQAGATLARATAMARHGSMSVPPSQDAHAGHHGDRVDHGNHGHGGHGGQVVTPADSESGSHKSVHAKAGCADCAKCCLLAASAPPPASAASFTPDAVRAAFLAQRAPTPSFLTDGPDRPPRHLAC